MSAFSQSLAAESPMKGSPCSVAVALNELDDESRADAIAAMSDPSISASRIHEAFVALHVRVGNQTVRRHRLGQCRCGTRLLP